MPQFVYKRGSLEPPAVVAGSVLSSVLIPICVRLEHLGPIKARLWVRV
jgi:hypothetical protein